MHKTEHVWVNILLPYTVRQGNRRSGWEVLMSPLVLRNFLNSVSVLAPELHADTIAVYDKAPATKSDASLGSSCLWNSVQCRSLSINIHAHNITLTSQRNQLLHLKFLALDIMSVYLTHAAQIFCFQYSIQLFCSGVKIKICQG